MRPAVKRTSTAKDLEVLRALRQHILGKGYAPSRIELGKMLGISGPVAHYHLMCLRKAGLVRIVPRKHRAVELTFHDVPTLIATLSV